MRERNLLMMRVLQSRRETGDADAWSGLAEVRGHRTLSIFSAAGWTRTRVGVFENGIRIEMKVGGAEGTKRRHASHELNGLQFAAEVKLENVTDCEAVRGGQTYRLETRSLKTDAGRGEAPHREREGGIRSVGGMMRERGTNDRCRGNTVANVADDGPEIVAGDGVL